MRLYALLATAVICLLILMTGNTEQFETRLAGHMFLFSQTLFVWRLWSCRLPWKQLLIHQGGWIATLCTNITSTASDPNLGDDVDPIVAYVADISDQSSMKNITCLMIYPPDG